MERSGWRDKIVVYGSVPDDGTRQVRTYDRFNGANFVRYPEPARQKWGKVLMIMDNAAQHKARKVRRYPEQNPGVRILYIPVARPELGAIEEIWRQAKYRLITSESCRTLDDLRRAGRNTFEHAQSTSTSTRILQGVSEAKLFLVGGTGLSPPAPLSCPPSFRSRRSAF